MTAIRVTEPSGSNGQIQIYKDGSFDGDGTLSFDTSSKTFYVTGSSTLSGSVSITSALTVQNGISGSLTQLQDGTSYLVAGSGIAISSASSGQVTITGNVGDITGVTAGTGLRGGGTSGTVTLNINDSVVATLSGSQFSGNVGVTGSIESTSFFSGSMFKAPILTGSLTQLHGGTSYLVAGSNVTIASSSNGQVTISTASELTGSSVIGVAEDSDYSDGLFTDFTTNTSVGIAVDRFNEILKALAPSPAPVLDDIDHNESSVTALLSFGSSNAISGYTDVGSGAGIEAAVDVNGTYQSTTTNNNMRIGVFDGANVVNGDLNEDVSANTHASSQVNYVANAFKNGDQGTLKLEVNGSVIHSVVLTGSVGAGVPGSGTGTSYNGNGSGFSHFSNTGSAYFGDGTELDLFQNRTGRYKVVANDQNDGWNYARVVHTIDETDTTTNYVEWVNDSDSNALAAAGSAFDTLSMSGDVRLSGITYHTAGTAAYRVRVTNAYRNVYTNSSISFSTSNCSVSSQTMPSIDTGSSEDETKTLHITGSATVSANSLLDGSITVSANVAHPLKSNISSGGSQTISGLLLWGYSNNSTVLYESFRREDYRLESGSYSAQSDVTDASNTWVSSKHLTGSNAYSDGLLFYNQRLVAPVQGVNSGDFRNSSDGGSISNGPDDNPNYGGITSGVRTFYRYFQNNSGGSKTDFTAAINGSGTIISQGSSLSTGNVYVHFKIPTTGGGESTGWLDLTTAFSTGQYSDGDGCLNGSLDSSLNASNTVTFGTKFLADNEYLVMKITADAAFTGYISTVTVTWL